MLLRNFAAGIALACALLLVGTGLVRADMLIMDNGDRITGTFIEHTDGTLMFRADYAATTLPVPWQQVSGLITDEIIRILLEDGTEIVGQAVETEPGRLRMVSGDLDEPVSFRVSRVTSITGSRTPPRDSVRTSGNINVGGTLTRGNTRTEAANANAAFEARTNVNRFRAAGEVNRASDDDELFRDDASASARYDHFVSERVYVNSSIALSRDRFRDLRLRSSAGVGLGYQIFENPRRSLSAELGGSYVSQEYYDAENETNPAFRWALDYEERLFTGIRLFHNQEGLQNLEDSSELLLRTRTGLRFPLIAGITGTIQANVDYDHSPPANSRSTDSAYLVTAGYSW
ncbi:MAG: DUF481 domain-containing protein [Aquisalimonadaceae bacterium]